MYHNSKVKVHSDSSNVEEMFDLIRDDLKSYFLRDKNVPKVSNLIFA